MWRPRAGSRSRPFFLVHGLGGNVLELIALVQALRTSRAVLALQARAITAVEPRKAATSSPMIAAGTMPKFDSTE